MSKESLSKRWGSPEKKTESDHVVSLQECECRSWAKFYGGPGESFYCGLALSLKHLPTTAGVQDHAVRSGLKLTDVYWPRATPPSRATPACHTLLLPPTCCFISAAGSSCKPPQGKLHCRITDCGLRVTARCSTNWSLKSSYS